MTLQASTILSPQCKDLCQGSCNQQCLPALPSAQCQSACQALCQQNCPKSVPKVPCQTTQQMQCYCPTGYQPCDNGTVCCMVSQK